MGVDRLLAATAVLDAPRIFERSAKISQGRIATDRGLVSVEKRAIYPGPKTTFAGVCSALGCPDVGPLLPHLGDASAIHFGADGSIGKAYLEFAPAEAPEDDLVFLAMKWRGGESRINRYTSMTGRDHAAKQALLAETVPDAVVADVMSHCLDLARAGDPDGEAVVLRVTEEGTGRTSIDVSVADAARTLGQLSSMLAPLQAFAGCSLRSLLDEYREARLGHIAAGTDSGGRVFVTLYFGARVL